MKTEAEIIISKSARWCEHLLQLRKIVLDCGLTEEIKWSQPCYTYKGKNVIILYDFKDSCGLSFFKGVLLKDRYNILQKPGENSNEGRIVRFTRIEDIAEMEATLKEYIQEAIEVERLGLKLPPSQCVTVEDMPQELLDIFAEMPDLQAAFDALTPGRQRGYILYFSAPKQSKTRTKRIEKYADRIFEGKGLNDYK